MPTQDGCFILSLPTQGYKVRDGYFTLFTLGIDILPIVNVVGPLPAVEFMASKGKYTKLSPNT